jgi:uncharacterized protein YdhG (YjbR/CyaY superfamily)
MNSKKFKSVDEYLKTIHQPVKSKLEKLRSIIKQTAPEAEEVISYNMPAYKYYGLLCYFMTHTNHIGFYPADSTFRKVFANELINYETSAGTIRFPHNKPVPVNLVKKIIKFRVNRNLEKQLIKKPLSK